MKRNLLNFSMTLLFLLVMSFGFLPKILHEVLGIIWLLPVLIHLWLNKPWFTSFFKKLRHIGGILSPINISLVILTATVIITGVIISNYLFKGWFGLDLARNITVRRLHVSLPYLMLILTGLYLGIHFKGLWRQITKGKSLILNSRRILFLRIGILILAALGVYGSFLNRMGDCLMMKHIFATEATNLPFWAYFLLLLGI